ncbi:MAG: hypothetical protein DRN37_00155 [Thermoplasmata archaeon]|nr:MAG: hypothetical protein DRN37_00155 [Thermoplasmata archaeon]
MWRLKKEDVALLMRINEEADTEAYKKVLEAYPEPAKRIIEQELVDPQSGAPTEEGWEAISKFEEKLEVLSKEGVPYEKRTPPDPVDVINGVREWGQQWYKGKYNDVPYVTNSHMILSSTTKRAKVIGAKKARGDLAHAINMYIRSIAAENREMHPLTPTRLGLLSYDEFGSFIWLENEKYNISVRVQARYYDLMLARYRRARVYSLKQLKTGNLFVVGKIIGQGFPPGHIVVSIAPMTEAGDD